jgi:hypothetical protein
MPQIKDLPIIRTVAASTDWLVMQAVDGTTFRIAKENLIGNAPVLTEVKLSGSAFGSTPFFSSTSGFTNAFDGNTATFYDFANANSGMVGLDLGATNTKKLTRIRFFPRAGQSARMAGGRFEGSNTSTTNGYSEIATISTAAEGWNEFTINSPFLYRYVKYSSPNGSYGNVAELEFYGA